MVKRIIKVFIVVFFTLFVILYITFIIYTAPKSNKEILKVFTNSKVIPKLTQEEFKGFSYRKISVVKDSTLPTMVFVHGTIGSLSNFSNYLSDSLLQTKANMIAYDRVGYNYKDKNNTQESIAFELGLLEDITKNLDKNKLIITGYSYGGPIALAFKRKIKKTVLLAPALYSNQEVIPWMVNFYKWKLTHWMVPDIWKQASKEKLSHEKDLKKFEENWSKTPNEVISIHGKKDWLVPYENSTMLKKVSLEDKVELISIEKANHNLIWSDFKIIKQHLLTILD